VLSILLIVQPLWQNKGRLLLSVGAITIGVALGYAVQLINRAAIDEMARASATLSGEAELTVRGPRAGFDEAVYARLAARPEVLDASPAVEVEARLAGRDETLRVIGLDVFRAAAVQPALVARESEEDEDPLDMLRPDAVFLSPAAAQWLRVARDDRIRLQAGLRVMELRVAGTLSEGAGRGRFAWMDIGAAQRLFDRIGAITRIDLDLVAGADAKRFVEQVASELPPGVFIERPESALQANARLTRAYRVNLNVLALVALFTGGLLVFSTQALSIVRRRSQLALLRVIGVTRRALALLLVAEGATVGLLGSALGVLLGIALAGAVLRLYGADLGAEYFRGWEATLSLDAPFLFLFLGFGIAAAVLGTLAPALDAARMPLARALRAGQELRAFERLKPAWPGLLFLVAGAALAAQRPVGELPVAGYSAIALLLIGTLLLMPRVTAAVAQVLPTGRSAWLRLSIAHLRQAAGQLSVGLAALVASVSLAVAMAIMVASFRDSLDAWLQRILPADLYVRAAPSGDTAYLDEAAQRRIAAVPGIRKVEFLRSQHILLDPARPRVTLIARDLEDPLRQIPLVRGAAQAARGLPAAWVSEHVCDVFGWQPGDEVWLPIAGQRHRFAVAGVWRDYARQNGAVLIERSVYVRLTGDRRANDAGVWLHPEVAPAAVAERIRAAVPAGEQLEIAQPAEIRAWSLRIFDRTFAVTYALEAVAIAIGLAGLSASFAANAFARRQEFGMLRHIGAGRREIAAMLACEGLIVSTIAALVGLVLGWVVSLLLVHVVNRQSFHWSMEMHYPIGGIAAFLFCVLVLAVATAVVGGRYALSGEAVRAVREDW
jgi:putative ABC transport system permease protein